MPSDIQQRPVEEGHDELVITMSSVSERDQYLKVYPNPMPSTHELAYHWEDDMHLVVGPKRVSGAKAAKGEDASRQFDGKTPQDLILMGNEIGLDLNPNMSGARMRALILEKQRGTPDPNAPAEAHRVTKTHGKHKKDE